MALTKTQAMDLISAATLFARHIEVLSPFEIETIADLGERFRLQGLDAPMTEPEHQVLSDALAALRKAAGRPLVERVTA